MAKPDPNQVHSIVFQPNSGPVLCRYVRTKRSGMVVVRLESGRYKGEETTLNRTASRIFLEGGYAMPRP